MFCSQCGAPAVVENGQVIRSCDHNSAAVIVELKATVYGESK